MKLTPLFRTHERAGAVLGELEGWRVAMRYGRHGSGSAVAVADWSWLTKVDVLGTCEEEPPAGVRWWGLGRGHGLVTCEPSREGAALEWVERVFSSATTVTGGYGCFLLFGGASRLVLNKLTSLDVREKAFPNGRAAQASVAHTQGILLRDDLRETPAFLLLVGRDYGESVWESVLHAGEEFGIAAVGVEEVRAL